MARHITRKELGEARRLGAGRRLYRRARRAGASHREIVSVLRSGKHLWKYEIARRVGDSHQQALSFLESGISPFDYEDLRLAGATHFEALDANREGVMLSFYAMARRLGIAREEAMPLVKAGLLHAKRAAWHKSAEALRALRCQGRDTSRLTERLAKLAPHFEGDAHALATQAAQELDEATHARSEHDDSSRTVA